MTTSTATEIATGKKPTYTAYQERQYGAKKYQTRIGAGWEQTDLDSITIRLDSVPLDGVIVLRRTPIKTND